ncbi:TKL family protein kinase [Tritrichomonas foetus]|uniref:TKL family protein kinase n=1 Tax=Tritrichomonas foetus TaxID=1144522 RepID=A0A1J4K1G1_9EUKA|nr:TKL family protein kinase [Tritrichomonas foetus]|eukprot:OHT05223.1 TKL family protein kinase [Tritrichomonas foetus]
MYTSTNRLSQIRGTSESASIFLIDFVHSKMEGSFYTMMTKRIAAEELLYICNDIEKLALQTVAHRKKFQFAINQFRTFCETYFEHTNDNPLNPQELEEFRKIIQMTREYSQMFSLNLLNSWAQTFLDGPSISVATDLNSLTVRLRDSAKVLDQDAADAFDPESPQWIQLHLLDLRAVITSLQQYIEAADPADEAIPLMTSKIQSIDNFFNEYEEDNILPGVRFFSPIPIHSQNWRLEHDDFTCEKQEGQGISSIVYYGHLKSTNEEVAVKKLKCEKLSGHKLRAFQREISVLATAEHPCVLKFVGATDTPPFCIVTEWLAGGTLYHDLRKFHRLDATGLTICAIDIAQGMRFLHSLQIIHRDLKSLNVLLDSNGNAKICDFGFSRQTNKDQLMTQNVGTPHWMAPELLGGSISYDEKIDVYAYGIVLWEIMTQKLPYVGLEASQIIGQVLLNDIRPTIPPNSPPEFTKLIEMCWARDPRNRPSFEDIMKMWRKGTIMLPGANPQIIIRHLQQCINESDRATDDIESHLNSLDRLNSCGLGLPNLYEALQKDGIPASLADKCWENLQLLPKIGKEDIYIKCVALFLSTTFAAKAAAILREMPSGSIPREIAVTASSFLPTGNDKLDMDLIMIACKNNAAGEAALHSIQKEQVTIALEIVAREGMHPDNKSQICARCIQCLTINDTMLNVAALRCLIANNEAKSIPFSVMKTHIQSRNITLKMATHIAAAKMTEEGVQIPNEILDLFIAKLETVPIAGTVIVNACRNLESAKYILERFAFGTAPPAELTARIIIQANKHPQLKEAVMKWLIQNPLPYDETESSQAIQRILAQNS